VPRESHKGFLTGYCILCGPAGRNAFCRRKALKLAMARQFGLLTPKRPPRSRFFAKLRSARYSRSAGQSHLIGVWFKCQGHVSAYAHQLEILRKAARSRLASTWAPAVSVHSCASRSPSRPDVENGPAASSTGTLLLSNDQPPYSVSARRWARAPHRRASRSRSPSRTFAARESVRSKGVCR
jgi:hypothetical protein